MYQNDLPQFSSAGTQTLYKESCSQTCLEDLQLPELVPEGVDEVRCSAFHTSPMLISHAALWAELWAWICCCLLAHSPNQVFAALHCSYSTCMQVERLRRERLTREERLHDMVQRAVVHEQAKREFEASLPPVRDTASAVVQ